MLNGRGAGKEMRHRANIQAYDRCSIQVCTYVPIPCLLVIKQRVLVPVIKRMLLLVAPPVSTCHFRVTLCCRYSQVIYVYFEVCVYVGERACVQPLPWPGRSVLG